MVTKITSVLWLCCALPGAVAGTYTYIGDIGATTVLVAWGSPGGPGNSIGRESRSMGAATVTVGDRSTQTSRNWAEVTGLQSDTPYDYQVVVDGQRIGSGRVRTYPLNARSLVFFVLGDYGNGSQTQYRVAAAMWSEFQRRSRTSDPVRFILSTGDNIYADVNVRYYIRGSGNADRDWERKFFEPYRELLRQIPVHPTLGNHDGNDSENRGDLAVYLDNFFFPHNQPARWYGFSYAGLADFFALDTTSNSDGGRRLPAYDAAGEQSAWLSRALPASQATWKIPYFHHPPFNAGPFHGSSLVGLQHWVDLFAKSGVRVVFNGHEHNLQFSEVSDATRQIRWCISGAGGELRSGNVLAAMERAHIAGWAAQPHFLIVEIDGGEMHITPQSYEPFTVRDRNGKAVAMPVVVKR